MAVPAGAVLRAGRARAGGGGARCGSGGGGGAAVSKMAPWGAQLLAGPGRSRPSSPRRPHFFYFSCDSARRGLGPDASALARFLLPSRLRPDPLPGLRALSPPPLSPPSSLPTRPGLAEPRALSPVLHYFRSCPPSRAVRSRSPRVRPSPCPPGPFVSGAARGSALGPRRDPRRHGPPREPRGARPCSRGLYLSAAAVL